MTDRKEIEYHSGQVGMDYRNELDKEEINKLKKENARLREELNNSMNFHCKYYLTNGGGTVSCQYEEIERGE